MNKVLVKDKIFDAVIIGAGLSGLSSAYELKGHDFIILERGAEAGGRVLTRDHSGICYDLGATFAPMAPSVGHQQAYGIETGKIGINYKGKNYVGDSVMACILQLGLPRQELARITKFKDRPCAAGLLRSMTFPQETYRLLNCLFRVIHPGEIKDYSCARQKDAFKNYEMRFYPNGNRDVVNPYKKALASKIELNVEVLSVEDNGEYVTILCREGKRLKRLVSKAVIVATPAPVTKKILKRIGPPCLSFLKAVKYGSFTVVVIGFKDVAPTACAYVLTPDCLSSVIIAKRAIDKGVSALFVYYGDKESKHLAQTPEAEVISQTINIILRLKVWDISRKNILFSDIKRWDCGGTIVSDQMLKKGARQGYAQPSRRVFIAGDYVQTNNLFPYGMDAAISSGRFAAQQVKDLLGYGVNLKEGSIE